MKGAKITALSLNQFADILISADDYITHEANHSGIVVSMCHDHPELGDIILISDLELNSGGLMIHT